jgi:septin family protein
LILSLVEGFRRAQWSLIRIENENVNNFERYRNILQIPAFKDDEEEMEQEEGKK